ncbi:hypothetical protein [Agrobacterium vacciniicorymbosi]|uniref:hypothetical protein n=1 Tax=Agrobacterium sp. BA1120 TaxID=3228927 RepID=UPI00336A1C46
MNIEKDDTWELDVSSNLFFSEILSGIDIPFCRRCVVIFAVRGLLLKVCNAANPIRPSDIQSSSICKMISASIASQSLSNCITETLAFVTKDNGIAGRGLNNIITVTRIGDLSKMSKLEKTCASKQLIAGPDAILPISESIFSSMVRLDWLALRARHVPLFK